MSLDDYNKFFIGFSDQIRNLSEHAKKLAPKIPNYPPFNIKKIDDNKYVIEMAVAGFGKQDIEIELDGGTLVIKGKTSSGDEMLDNSMHFPAYLFKGISSRAFTRQFTLADNIEIKNADLLNGMLQIWLEAITPEHAKPKKIKISDSKEDVQ